MSGLERLEKLGVLVRSLSLSFSSSTTLHDELGFLTAWQFQIKWYPAPPRVSIPKGQDRSCKPLEDPASEAPERHSPQIVLVKQVMKSSLGSGKGNPTLPLHVKSSTHVPEGRVDGDRLWTLAAEGGCGEQTKLTGLVAGLDTGLCLLSFEIYKFTSIRTTQNMPPFPAETH